MFSLTFVGDPQSASMGLTHCVVIEAEFRSVILSTPRPSSRSRLHGTATSATSVAEIFVASISFHLRVIWGMSAVTFYSVRKSQSKANHMMAAKGNGAEKIAKRRERKIQILQSTTKTIIL